MCNNFKFEKPYTFFEWHRSSKSLLFFDGIVNVGQATLSAVLAIKMSCHENACTTIISRTLTSQSVNLSVVIHAVVFQHRQLNFLVLVFDFLWCGVILLLAFLTTTTKAQHQVQCWFCVCAITRISLISLMQQMSQQGYYQRCLFYIHVVINK